MVERHPAFFVIPAQVGIHPVSLKGRLGIDSAFAGMTAICAQPNLQMRGGTISESRPPV